MSKYEKKTLKLTVLPQAEAKGFPLFNVLAFFGLSLRQHSQF
jgi:hypothetical protein